MCGLKLVKILIAPPLPLTVLSKLVVLRGACGGDRGRRFGGGRQSLSCRCARVALHDRIDQGWKLSKPIFYISNGSYWGSTLLILGDPPANAAGYLSSAER